MQNLTVVFDLDGILVDTAPDLVAATNHALAGIDLPPVAAHIAAPVDQLRGTAHDRGSPCGLAGPQAGGEG